MSTKEERAAEIAKRLADAGLMVWHAGVWFIGGARIADAHAAIASSLCMSN